ncbi:ABC transporter ATP-binding protein [Cellulosilyticum lentocellum]|uniref:Sulfate-transporting ATPase n=1 Tax=Cellulosilyticum lentocellum (strain ATCC 49066 / DSM 5427 / NCIMB 11756 / RHM5) TaxID=642492 RepID=F2JIH4_CELLD|nr:ATP-binding cassette domain-containing protein [Cellulosilyticum lentocellum]ADZ84340.1 Sulfate-transporting ATPase [Cellulosilyticum lentocellum DSM 5427]
MEIITTNDLCKRIGDKQIIDHVSIHVKQGEIYGFLGPNGAGKTTLMRMLLHLVKADSGSIQLFGEEISEMQPRLLRRIGNMIEYPIFYNHLTVKENLELQCSYMEIEAEESVANALKLVRLQGMANEKVSQFSAGMRQRLGIARALVHRPELLILDEPVNGLDPIGIKDIRELLKFLCREQGITILISSHILSEIELIADTIGCIKGGQLLEEVALADIKANEQTSLEEHFLNVLSRG